MIMTKRAPNPDISPNLGYRGGRDVRSGGHEAVF